MIWFLLLLTAAIAAPFVIEHYRAEMSDGRRGSAPGQFAELSQGLTHFHLSGPKDGPLIVCVHGLTTPSFVWGPLTKELTARGFRVLVYDLYGRGFSDRHDGIQDKIFFNQQLNDLLSHLDINDAFHLIGYSMGGAIATGFAASYPARVRRLVLLASAGMTLIETPLLKFIRDRGAAGKWLMLMAYPAQLRRGIRAEQELAIASPEISEGQKAQLDFKGFVPAVLASVRGILSKSMEGEHMTLRRNGLAVLALWGAEDDVISASAMGQLAAWNSDVTQEVIKGAGHGLPYTHTDQVLTHVSRFLSAPARDERG